MLKSQILLSRLGFSPGALDGRAGDNLRKALIAFQRANGLEESGMPDSETLEKLAALSPEPELSEYEIAASDVEGPFAANIPTSLEEQASLPRLDYTSPREALAERFHMDERLLSELNPGADFSQAGTRIKVVNVMRNSSPAMAVKIIVDKQARSLSAFDAEGKLVGFYPISIGSTDKPAPSGVFKVNGVQKNPTYYYDPKYAFKDVKVQRKFSVQPGPNNPVGVAWIALSIPSYGIHGTAWPEKIGKTESHGCIRMTNWDVLDLAAMVHPGTVVEFQG